MIKSIKFKKMRGHDLSYISELPALEELGEIEFKPGINIIIGPNGSGKTAILKALGTMFAAKQYGESCLSMDYLMDFVHRKEEGRFDFPFEVVHDGQAVLYADPDRQLGFSHGEVDRECEIGGLQELLSMNKESSGQRSSRRVNPFFNILLGKAEKPQGLGAVFKPEEINETYRKAIGGYVENVFTGTLPKTQMTVLMDEVEKSLSLMNQVILWQKIMKDENVRKNFQIIMVSHSSEAIDIEGANYIELKKGYLEGSRKVKAGELSIEEAIELERNIKKKLTKEEDELLIKLESESSLDGNEEIDNSKEIQHLIDIGYIDVWTKESEDKTMNLLDAMDTSILNVYTLSEKGSQYLNMYKD